MVFFYPSLTFLIALSYYPIRNIANKRHYIFYLENKLIRKGEILENYFLFNEILGTTYFFEHKISFIAM
jgi:hypothetical protein